MDDGHDDRAGRSRAARGPGRGGAGVLGERAAARVPGQGHRRGHPDPVCHRAHVDRGAARDRARSGAGLGVQAAQGTGVSRATGSAPTKSGATCGRAWSTADGCRCSAAWCPCSSRSLIGGTLGVVAGFAGRIVNTVIMRTMDVLYAFPSILLAIAICGMLGAGLGNTILALTVTFIPPIVRISETVTTQVRGLDFVEAARASGGSALSVHPPSRAEQRAGADPGLRDEPDQRLHHPVRGALSFLGLGVTPPNPEWGLMLNTLRSGHLGATRSSRRCPAR